MRKFVYVMGAALTALALSQPADASLILTVSGTGGAPVTTLSATNGVNWSGTVGQFTVSVVAGAANVPGTSTQATLNITSLVVTNTGATPGVFTIDLVGQGFTMPGAPGSPMGLSTSGSWSSPLVTEAGQSLTQAAFSDPDNGATPAGSPVSCNMPLGVGSTVSGNCQSGEVAWVRSASGLFSLRDVLTFNLAAGQEVNGTSSVRAVPEPAVLFMLGAALVGAGRRLRKA